MEDSAAAALSAATKALGGVVLTGGAIPDVEAIAAPCINLAEVNERVATLPDYPNLNPDQVKHVTPEDHIVKKWLSDMTKTGFNDSQVVLAVWDRCNDSETKDAIYALLKRCAEAGSTIEQLEAAAYIQVNAALRLQHFGVPYSEAAAAAVAAEAAEEEATEAAEAVPQTWKPRVEKRACCHLKARARQHRA